MPGTGTTIILNNTGTNDPPAGANKTVSTTQNTPYFFQESDFGFTDPIDFPAISELPSHYFRQNIYLTFIDEADAIKHAHDRLGIENIMWSSDYPHPVGSWPNSRATVERIFAGESDEDRDLVCSGNAARVWNL